MPRQQNLCSDEGSGFFPPMPTTPYGFTISVLVREPEERNSEAATLTYGRVPEVEH